MAVADVAFGCDRSMMSRGFGEGGTVRSQWSSARVLQPPPRSGRGVIQMMCCLPDAKGMDGRGWLSATGWCADERMCRRVRDAQQSMPAARFLCFLESCCLQCAVCPPSSDVSVGSQQATHILSPYHADRLPVPPQRVSRVWRQRARVTACLCPSPRLPRHLANLRSPTSSQPEPRPPIDEPEPEKCAPVRLILCVVNVGPFSLAGPSLVRGRSTRTSLCSSLGPSVPVVPRFGLLLFWFPVSRLVSSSASLSCKRLSSGSTIHARVWI